MGRFSRHLCSFLYWLVSLSIATAVESPDGTRLPGMETSWWYVKSPHFELYCQEGEEVGRHHLHTLEVLRALLITHLTLTERSKVDITVYSFRHEQDFRAYLPENSGRSGQRCAYFRFPDRAVILCAPSSGEDASRRTVYQEYVHHLFRSTGHDPAPWYLEGVAGLFSSLREEQGQWEYGHPHPAHLAALRAEKLLPLQILFSSDPSTSHTQSDEQTGHFHAQAWALLHYWRLGESGISRAAVDRFLAIASDRTKASAVDLRLHFRFCFSMDYADMLRQLDRYVSRGNFRIGRAAMPEVAPASSFQVTDVQVDLLRRRLADLALRTRQSPLGKSILLQAVAAGTVDPRPLEALGAEALRVGDETGAERLWGEAETAGSTNSAMLRELTRLDTKGWFDGHDSEVRVADERVRVLRARLLLSIRHDPGQAEAYETLAWVEALAARPDEANVNTVQEAFPQLVRKQRTLLALAWVRQRLGRTEEARSLLRDMPDLAWDDWAAQGGEQLLARIEGRPAKRLPAPPSKPQERVNPAREIKGFLKKASVELPESQ